MQSLKNGHPRQNKPDLPQYMGSGSCHYFHFVYNARSKKAGRSAEYGRGAGFEHGTEQITKISWMPIGTDGGGRCSGVYIKAKTGEDRTGAEKLMFQYTIEVTACIPSGRQRVLLLPVPH